MTTRERQPEPPVLPKDVGPLGLPQFSDREAACLVISDLDYDSQLAAIHYLLRRHREEDERLSEEIKRIDVIARHSSGLRNEYAIDQWTDHVHHSAYQHAAHSMAAVGMLASLVESLFYQTFQGIRQQMYEDPPLSAHARWCQPAEDQWDCRFVWCNGRRTKSVTEGIVQLAAAVGLDEHMPQDLKPTLEALFEYRNKMFHCGFEWPTDERARFQNRISKSGWPSGWFSTARSGERPWIFYLTDEFVGHCLRTIDRVIVGIGAFCKQRFLATARKRADV